MLVCDFTGEYLKTSARGIAESIANLAAKKLSNLKWHLKFIGWWKARGRWHSMSWVDRREEVYGRRTRVLVSREATSPIRNLENVVNLPILVFSYCSHFLSSPFVALHNAPSLGFNFLPQNKGGIIICPICGMNFALTDLPLESVMVRTWSWIVQIFNSSTRNPSFWRPITFASQLWYWKLKWQFEWFAVASRMIQWPI